MNNGLVLARWCHRWLMVDSSIYGEGRLSCVKFVCEAWPCRWWWYTSANAWILKRNSACSTMPIILSSLLEISIGTWRDKLLWNVAHRKVGHGPLCQTCHWQLVKFWRFLSKSSWNLHPYYTTFMYMDTEDENTRKMDIQTCKIICAKCGT